MKDKNSHYFTLSPLCFNSNLPNNLFNLAVFVFKKVSKDVWINISFTWLITPIQQADKMLIINMTISVWFGVIKKFLQKMILNGKFERFWNVLQFSDWNESGFCLIYVNTCVIHEKEVFVVHFAKFFLYWGNQCRKIIFLWLKCERRKKDISVKKN